jgi:DNA-binding beta-propeller fold protein YncE
VLDARSGRILRTIPLGLTPTALAVDERTGSVFVLTWMPVFHGSGMLSPAVVSVLDARTGAVLRTVPVGLSAAALAVDERTGQAFVSNRHDSTVLVLVLVHYPLTGYMLKPSLPY